MTNPKLKDKHMDLLCDALLSLNTQEECYQFLEDICTVAELKALAQRLQVAHMLNNNHTYEDVVAATGASTATISRVKRCLNYGADGYNTVLKRIKND